MKGLDTFKNVVVLMLENRSFDNLLGNLYQSHEIPHGKSFAGLQNGPLSVPVPKRAVDFTPGKTVSTHQAENYHQPYPDPGEEYQHVNTQLFNHVDPDNIGMPQEKMKPPYNIPNPEPAPPPMTGFVNDYINTLDALHTGEKITEDMYKGIMGCFTNEQIPVLTTLAKEFAVFDHWFCSVPSQTWCNRAFWHAATSGGEVINPLDEGAGAIGSVKDMYNWIDKVWTKPTLFDRLHEADLPFKIYSELFPLTSLINGIKYIEHTKFRFKDFLNDAKNGTLPAYAFVEPKFFGQHNDQHPSSENKPTRDGTVILGEKLIWDVYEAIKNSPQRDETLLIITYDEHGGCFDHVAPPETIPPDTTTEGALGFHFNRLGVRVPMVMISSYIEKNTIINENFDHSSFIRTMSDKWNLKGLTNRDKHSNSFAHVFSDQKRTDYPEIPKPHIKQESDLEYLKDKLHGLQRSILNGLHALAHIQLTHKQNTNVSLKNPAEIKTVGEAISYIEQLKGYIV